ncbi:MAG TPA: DUF4388 domain-containing protein [Ktedonobacterales bacterium]|nr:DUF4388 domain-containing protein [Ktedonobacterales bacterium]
MDRAHPLAELVSLIATIRSQGRTARLALHNTERFGLLHLSFEQGRLVRVEGNAGGPSESLYDLESWRHGAIRIEPLAPGAAGPSGNLPLESLLDATLAQMERARIVHSAPPALSHQDSLPDLTADAFSTAGARDSRDSREDAAIFASSIPTVPTLHAPAVMQDMALSGVTAHSGPQRATGPTGAELTDPQWQLLALAVRQITDQAAMALGPQMSQTLLVDALAQASAGNSFLRQLKVDGSGWLWRQEGTGRGATATFEAAQAIATLLAVLESHLATRLGTQRVRRLITTAVAPLRNSLEQIGLTVVSG